MMPTSCLSSKASWAPCWLCSWASVINLSVPLFSYHGDTRRTGFIAGLWVEEE